MTRHHIKYFPFCPGIPWDTKFGKLVPQITSDNWNDHVKDKPKTILAHGGLIESFWSLSLARAIQALEPLLKPSWAGPEAFKNLILAAEGLPFKSVPDVGHKYPTPIFMDKQRNIYFNALNQYLFSNTVKLKLKKNNPNPIFKQIFTNALLPWDKKYTPRITRFDYGPYNKWAKSIGFFDNKKFILIIDKTIYSEHSVDLLNWDNKDILNFAGLMRRFGIEILYCSPRKIYNNQLIHMVPENDLSILIPLIERCWIILSRDVDYLLLALMISKTTIVANGPQKYRTALNLFENADFIESESMIYSYGGILSPKALYTLVERLNNG